MKNKLFIINYYSHLSFIIVIKKKKKKKWNALNNYGKWLNKVIISLCIYSFELEVFPWDLFVLSECLVSFEIIKKKSKLSSITPSDIIFSIVLPLELIVIVFCVDKMICIPKNFYQYSKKLLKHILGAFFSRDKLP